MIRKSFYKISLLSAIANICREEMLDSMVDYVFKGTGPATLLGGVETLGFISTKFVNRSMDNPDIEFHFVSGTFASDGVKIANGQGIGHDMWKRYYRPLENRDAISMTPMLLRPKSVGSIKLRSKNPFIKPILNAGYFSHPEDIKVLVEGKM